MRFLFYLAHPAHFHLFKNTIRSLKAIGHDVKITIKSKDVLQQLLDESRTDYVNISPKEKKPGRLGTLIAFIERNREHLRIVRQWKPDIFVSTSAEFAPIAKLLRIRTVSFFEDDLELFPWYSRLLVPFLDLQVCPQSCSAGKWNAHPKTIKYRGNHELAYLSPIYFKPNLEKTKHLFSQGQKHFLLRFSGLSAWHDQGVQGLNDQLARKVVDRLLPYGRIFITSERKLPDDLDRYRLHCPAELMQDILAQCDLVIGDSQTMTAEAAVLGTPAIRINDFVGKLGYLKELEETYGLCFGYKPDQQPAFLEKVSELAEDSSTKKNFGLRRQELLRNSIDPTAYFVKLLTEPITAVHSKDKRDNAIHITSGTHA
jgi:predicted glycosyltransferase